MVLKYIGIAHIVWKEFGINFLNTKSQIILTFNNLCLSNPVTNTYTKLYSCLVNIVYSIYNAIISNNILHLSL